MEPNLTKRTIGIASVIYGVAILLSRLIGLVRESVIGRVLGVGSEADVYWTAFIIPDFLNYLLAGGILSIAFIPLFQKRFEVSEASANELFSTLFNSPAHCHCADRTLMACCPVSLHDRPGMRR